MTRLLLPVLYVCAAYAQDYRATISGKITDQHGAAIPNAKVRAVQRATNEVTAATTNQEGYYALNCLQPGVFDVEVEATGFSLQKHANLTLLVAQKLDLLIQLEVG